MGSLITGILAGIVVIIAALFQYSEKKAEEQEAVKNKQQADSALHELKELQIDNKKNLNELSESYKKNAALEREMNNYVTGGHSIPVLTPNVRFYALDHYARWNGPQVEDYIDKWIIEFKVSNSDVYPIYNIRSYRIITGSDIEKDSSSYTTNILGPKEERELQPTYILGDKQHAGTYNIKVNVQWQMVSYDCYIRLDVEEFKDKQGLPFLGFIAKTVYEYHGHEYSDAKDLKKALLNSFPSSTS